jgi:hypothetical protein
LQTKVSISPFFLFVFSLVIRNPALPAAVIIIFLPFLFSNSDTSVKDIVYFPLIFFKARREHFCLVELDDSVYFFHPFFEVREIDLEDWTSFFS